MPPTDRPIPPPPRPRAQLVGWHSLCKNTLRGYATPTTRCCVVEFHVVRRGSLIGFSTHGSKASWLRQIVAALKVAYPGLFADAETAGARVA